MYTILSQKGNQNDLGQSLTDKGRCDLKDKLAGLGSVISAFFACIA
jgi:hypothetical protein